MLRSIAAELDHRINQLRKDPTKRAELEDRIGKYIFCLSIVIFTKFIFDLFLARIKARRMTKSDLKNIVEDNKKLVKEC